MTDPIAVHRPRRPAAPARRRIDEAIAAGRRPWRLHHGAGGRGARGGARRVLRRAARARPAPTAPTRSRLVLMAKGVEPGDAVLCPTFTFAATAEVVAWLGATPVFVDVHRGHLQHRPGTASRPGSRRRERRASSPVGVIPVDLFGQPADYDAIEPICARDGLWVLSRRRPELRRDLHGPQGRHDRRLATTTSFFPAKPLGCYGDGGAIFTDDDELAAVHALAPRARPGHGQVRQRADRHERPARHDAGRDPDREARRSSPTRSRRATASPQRYNDGSCATSRSCPRCRRG